MNGCTQNYSQKKIRWASYYLLQIFIHSFRCMHFEQWEHIFLSWAEEMMQQRRQSTFKTTTWKSTDIFHKRNTFQTRMELIRSFLVHSWVWIVLIMASLWLSKFCFGIKNLYRKYQLCIIKSFILTIPHCTFMQMTFWNFTVG